jgi:hypothetical protein
MQVAIYKGSIPDSKHAYQLDDHHRFEKGRPQLVCGNTAAMVRGARHQLLKPLHACVLPHHMNCINHVSLRPARKARLLLLHG